MPFVTSIERFAREEGLVKGRQEGREQGREEGREEGLSRGQMLALKESIQDLLEARFGVTPAGDSGSYGRSFRFIDLAPMASARSHHRISRCVPGVD